MKTQSIVRSISMLFFLCIYLISTAQENASFIGVWRSGENSPNDIPHGKFR